MILLTIFIFTLLIIVKSQFLITISQIFYYQNVYQETVHLNLSFLKMMFYNLNNEQILNLLYDIKTIRLVLQLQYQNLKEQILNSDLKELKNIKIEFHTL